MRANYFHPPNDYTKIDRYPDSKNRDPSRFHGINGKNRPKRFQIEIESSKGVSFLAGCVANQFFPGKSPENLTSRIFFSENSFSTPRGHGKTLAAAMHEFALSEVNPELLNHHRPKPLQILSQVANTTKSPIMSPIIRNNSPIQHALGGPALYLELLQTGTG